MALELGPCQVKFGTAGSEVDLGKTQGGVVIHLSQDVTDLMSDQFGSAPEDAVITGDHAEVEIPFAELDFDLIASILNQTKFGANAGVPGENNVGTQMLANAQSLLLIKYSAGVPSTDLADQIRFPAAHPKSDVELTYDAENQRVLKATFRCFPKIVNANWGTASPANKTVLYIFGDETATS